jgi:recyclin-1
MDRWTTLEPVRLHGSSNSISGKPIGTSNTRTNASHAHQNRAQFIGRLPSELHLLIFHFLAIPDIPRYARVNRALSKIAGDERLWERRWKILIGSLERRSGNSDNEAKIDEVLREVELRGTGNVTGSGISTGYHVRNLSGSVDLGSLGSPSRAKAPGVYNSATHGSADPTIFTAEDEFGDFAHADLASDEFDDFVGAPPAISKPSAFTPMPAMSFPSTTRPPPPQNQAFSIYSSASRKKFRRAYTLLRPLLPLVHPSTPPHTLLSLLLPTPPPPPQATPSKITIKEATLLIQAKLLALMTRFLSLTFQPCRDWEIKSHSLRACADVFDANMLKLFEDADGKKDESLMRDAAWASWEVHTAWSKPQPKKVTLHHGTGLKSNLGLLSSLERRRPNDWELVKVWIERREEFYVHGQWDPSANVT